MTSDTDLASPRDLGGTVCKRLRSSSLAPEKKWMRARWSDWAGWKKSFRNCTKRERKQERKWLNGSEVSLKSGNPRCHWGAILNLKGNPSSRKSVCSPPSVISPAVPILSECCWDRSVSSSSEPDRGSLDFDHKAGDVSATAARVCLTAASERVSEFLRRKWRRKKKGAGVYDLLLCCGFCSGLRGLLSLWMFDSAAFVPEMSRHFTVLHSLCRKSSEPLKEQKHWSWFRHITLSYIAISLVNT